MKPRAIFVRHAEAEGQDEISKGRADLPLDAKGMKESEQIGRTVSKFHPGIVFTSPLQRARIPAEQIAKRSDAPLVVVNKLKPWDFGTDTGKPVDKVEPKLRNLWRNHPDKKMPQGQSFNESLADERQAIKPVRQAIADGKRPAVVWHSRQARQADHVLLNGPTHDPTHGGPKPGEMQLLSGKRLILADRKGRRA